MPVAESSSGSSRRGRGTDAPPYDRLVTVFSSEGRLYQVGEFARNPRPKTQSSMRSAAMPRLRSLMARPRRRRRLRVERREAGGRHLRRRARGRLRLRRRPAEGTKGEGDGRSLAHEARNQSAEFRFTWGYEMPPDVLAQWIADRAQICTQHVSKRPSGVVAMILGIDEEKETPQLFTCDPAGYFLGHKAVSAGLKEMEATNFLEKKMKNNPSLSFQATIEMAISALRHALQGDLKATEIEVGVVRNDDPIFRLLTEAEIEEHLKAITTLKQS